MKTIGIIGLGQIGGSLVLALRKRRLPFRIIGIDTSRRILQLLNFQLDVASTRWEKALEADFVVVCLHYKSTIQLLQHWPADHPVMDVCSGKTKILEAAERRSLRFVGGHPLAGNEKEREKGWNSELFQDAPFFLVPARNSAKEDHAKARRIVKALGARPIVVDPLLHDQCLAKSSHFPAILSRLLVETNVSVPPHFLGPGYKSMTRLADTSPELIQTFLDSNRENILKSAREFQRALTRWIKQNS